MASWTVIATHPSLTLNRVFNITDAEMVRIATACRNYYTPPGQPLITNQQAMDRIADEFWGRLRNITRDYELRQAQAAVVVDPIAPT